MSGVCVCCSRWPLLRRVSSLSISIEIPLLVVKWADRASLQPARNAVEVESVVADTPRLVAFFLRVGHLVRLAVHAWLHNMVTADGTVVDMDVPAPESHGIPFLDFKSSSRRFHHCNHLLKFG